jgi:serine/threonine protein kinase
MSAGEHSRIKTIFGEALECQGPQRAAYLDNACAGDRELREHVEALLAAAEKADAFLSDATVEVPPALASAAPMKEAPGSRIGPYKLLQLIGEGGFGSVFLAEQERPVRRRVALKIIKLGMDTRAVVARFEQERQALALMDHPNIAKVLDAGATETGRPYFVMELVKGNPITQFCDRDSLTIVERLGLFTQVCQAVQHAHTKGIIHRDIKPSNVLVSIHDGRPVARVIDFGIAKATDHRLTEKTVFTELRQLVGTPEYMSPEQAEGSLDIDTRTDVYSLGVLLYELLTGSTPFDPARLRSAAYGELQRIIREDEPQRPSTRLSQSTLTLPDVAAHRRVEPRKLGTLVRGELDWIVMRALEKDRARRYESAGGLASDVQRYLAGDDVTAAPPTASYRFRKFVRRNRAVVIAASFVGAALLLGVAGTTAGLLQARVQRDKAVAAESLATDRLAQAEKARDDADKARDRAERFNNIANAVTEFFTMDVLDVTPTPAGTPEPTVRQLLDAVPPKIDKYFKSEPAVEGIIRERVGQLYRRLGEIDRSSEYLNEAIPLLEKGLGPDNKQTLAATHRLGELHMDLFHFDKAAEFFDKAYQGRLRAFGTDYSLTMNSLARRGVARVSAGRQEDGFRDLQQALAHYQNKDGKDSRNAVVVGSDLCSAYVQAGRAKEAQALSRELLGSILTKQGAIAGLEWPVRLSLGNACRMLGELDESLTQLDTVLRITQEVYPPTHYEFIDIRLARGRTLTALRRHAEARTELEAAYTIATSVYPASSVPCRDIAGALVALAEQEGDAQAAELWGGRGGARAK